MKTMTYEEALDYLHKVQRFGSKPGLQRVEALLAALGHPELSLRFVHVAGTNGKGSTAAMTESVLRAAGYRTGLFVSPFVEDFRERVQVDGVWLPKDEWAARLSGVRAAAAAVTASGGPQATEFELLTALALRCFADRGCDVVVLEVGLGGRFDATNVIPPPEVAVLTPISRDHMEYLGETLASIAFEKCGIVKRGCHVVTGVGQPPEAMAVVRACCEWVGAPLWAPDETQLCTQETGLAGTRFIYRGQALSVPLMGAHQVQNALTACETVRALVARGWAVPAAAAARGLASVRWGGRLEIVRETPLCVIDGAHNAAKTEALARALDTLFAGRRRVVVMGMSADKETALCAEHIAARSDVFIATQYENPRALPAGEMARQAAPHCAHVEVYPDPDAACARALALCGQEDLLLVCGSLYLIGGAKRSLTTAAR
ncbi:MAG: bifunctional folylpolyglutamate synthase/dihydrofolate synthase [Oscillospiraceae bacterium]|jgi:dihydrofolate synthase/folylpolyglutamate synthase|nr:bifunctional folylpolyglutamate synthase/dihydrofolate synthase [Oscillospiraceae bacterium]